MPFSHHSHSGQFCGHASNTLEEIVLAAIEKRLTLLCLTEHMPREAIDFYPEEAACHTEESLSKLYDDFYHEARRLQRAYASQIQLFVGFESEWIRKSSLRLIQELLQKHPVDLLIGSVHHVHTVPIDYDTALYHKAREIAGGTDERIFEDYFDSQFEMLQAVRPPIVGHFDLIRLKSDDPDRTFRTWPAVWSKIERNLNFIAGYGGVLELNSSSLRKGMVEAYPQIEICRIFKDMGGLFTLSDDSHGIDQLALNYQKVFDTNIAQAGLTGLVHLCSTSDSTKAHDQRFPSVCWIRMSALSAQGHSFFNQ